jgi:transcription initiation factor TFIID subunit TAF12
LQQPWITATDGLNSAAAVFAAAEAGQLPAVLDYAASSSAEWIEFERPTQTQLQQQQQQQQQQHRSAAGGSGSGSGSSSQLSGVLFFPVLWFR